MIVLNPEDLKDQAGMERALRGYFADAAREYDGQFNAMLRPALFECDYQNNTATLYVDPKPWMGNPLGILHGGVSASILDMSMGLLCRYYSGGYMTPTIHLDVNYLRPGALDRRLYIRAELTKAGLSVCYASAALWAEGSEDRLIATASGAYYASHR